MIQKCYVIYPLMFLFLAVKRKFSRKAFTEEETFHLAAEKIDYQFTEIYFCRVNFLRIISIRTYMAHSWKLFYIHALLMP